MWGWEALYTGIILKIKRCSLRWMDWIGTLNREVVCLKNFSGSRKLSEWY